MTPMRPRGDDEPLAHFSCHGPLQLITAVPGEFLRVGDTASAEDDGEPQFWRCTRIVKPHGANWEHVGAWDKDGSTARIAAADLFVIVASPLDVKIVDMPERGQA